jgi:hypothetical protein
MAKISKAPDLGVSLDRARAVSAKLTAATEKLNASLTQIEADLQGLSLGVTASVEMEREAFDGYAIVRNLRFGKENREWKLMYESGTDGDDDWTSTPLLNTSREIRLKAVDHLGALIEKLVKTAEQEVGSIATKANEVEALARHVRTGCPF